MIGAPETLAIDGGTPIRKQMLPYGRQTIDRSDIDAVVQALTSDWLTTGPMVAEFERRFAKKVGARHAVAVANGTAALHAAAFAAGVDANSEAIVPAMTFASSANCIRFLGGTVLFADVRRDTLNVDVASVEALIHAKGRAIVAVDYAGQPADLDELLQLAQRHDLRLIEDASHALGATYKGRTVGSIADLTTFSLHPVKHVTTGEGGVVTTNDDELAERARRFRNHGITTDHRQREIASSWWYEMVELGYNYRLTDIQCALGISQLEKLDRWMARRREIVAAYCDAFAGMTEIEIPVELSDRRSAWHLYVIRLRLERLRTGREKIFQALRAENIGVNVHYIPVPWHPYYRRLGYSKGSWPVAESEYERLITLPLFPAMTNDDVDDVIHAVRRIFEAYRR